MASQDKVTEWLITLEETNIDMQDEEGFTALHWSCTKDLETARKLLEEGASPAIQDSDGNTPIHIAAGFGHYEFAKEMALLVDGSLFIKNNVRNSFVFCFTFIILILFTGWCNCRRFDYK